MFQDEDSNVDFWYNLNTFLLLFFFFVFFYIKQNWHLIVIELGIN